MLNNNNQIKKDLAKEMKELALQAEEREAKSLASSLGLPYQNLATVSPQTQALNLIAQQEALGALCAPFLLKGKIVALACKNPQADAARKIEEKLKSAGYDIKIFIVSENSLRNVWRGYELVSGEKKQITGKVDVSLERIEDLKKNISNLKKLKEEIAGFSSPFTSQLLETILAGALVIDASDVHIEAEEKEARLRYRIDGALNDISKIPLNYYRSIVSRVKLLSGLKINIRTEAQDGRFTIKTSEANIEIRVSIIPSAYGETAVLRILNPKSIRLELEDLGFRKDDLNIIKDQISRPNGIILNTGPTGSGKTTTLYAFLRRVYRPEIKIITVEDPIEYHLSGITQTQVDKERSYTFANGLRSILRQDPDVILVGEIRDKETAEIAMQSALTGHLVFSTLHTNEAAGALPRLLDLDVESGILGSALNLSIAQRLARRLCSFCKQEAVLEKEKTEKIKKIIADLPERVEKPELKEEIKIFAPSPTGCEKCNFIGYKGRVAVIELLAVDSVISQEVSRRGKDMTILELRELAVERGMVSMLGDGVLKIISGITSVEEIESVLGRFL